MKLKEVAELFSGVGVQTTRQSTRLFHAEVNSECLELEEMGSPKVQTLAFLKAGEFEKAVECINRFGVSLRGAELDSAIAHFSSRMDEALQAEDMRAYKRNQRRIGALVRFRDSGLDPNSLVPLVELQEGYRGKILLVSISGGAITELVCLRSDDFLHHEILKNTETELLDLGLRSTVVAPLGGAWLQFESDGSIRIWGSSDAFGSCDKTFAAVLVRKCFPGRQLTVEP